jgi:hypothetical protein
MRVTNEAKPVIEKTLKDHACEFCVNFVSCALHMVVLLCLITVIINIQIYMRHCREENQLLLPTINLDLNVVSEYIQKYVPRELCELIRSYLDTGFSFRLRILPPPPCKTWKQNSNGSILVVSDHDESQIIYRLSPQQNERNVFRLFHWYDEQPNSKFITLFLRTNVHERVCVRLNLPSEFRAQKSIHVGVWVLGPNLIVLEDSRPQQYYWNIPEAFYQFKNIDEPFYGVVTRFINSQQYLIQDTWSHPPWSRTPYALKRPIVCAAQNALVRWDPRRQVMTVLIIYDNHHYEILRHKLDTSEIIQEMFLGYDHGKYQLWLTNPQTGYWAVMMN